MFVSSYSLQTQESPLCNKKGAARTCVQAARLCTSVSKRLLRENDSRSECIWQSHKDFPCFSPQLQRNVWGLTQCLFGVMYFQILNNASPFRHEILTPFTCLLPSLVAAVGRICGELCCVCLVVLTLHLTALTGCQTRCNLAFFC